MKKLSFKTKVFFSILYSLTIVLFIFSLKTQFITINIPSIKEMIFFGVFAVLTESFSVNFKSISFTTTFAVTTAGYFLFGPFFAIVISIVGLTFCVFKVEDGYKHFFNTPFYGTLFNYCVYVLQILIGNFVFILMGGNFYYNNQTNLLNNIFFALFVFVILAFVVNWLIISIMFSLFYNKKFSYGLISNSRLLVLNSIAMFPLAILLSIVYVYYSYFGIILMVFPIMLSRYMFTLYIDTKSQYMETINALMRAVEARDKYTEGHSQRVAELVKDISHELKYNDWKKDKLFIASLLHDVGKIGVDDYILNKPGMLTKEEYNIIKSHPETGYNILKDVKNLKDIVYVVKHHHERYDGKGYPSGTSGEELSLDVYIVQLADCIDAMATDRPYRKALSDEEILNEVMANSGSQFHPKVVDAYLSYLKRKNKIKQE